MKIFKIITLIFLGILLIPSTFADYKPNIDDEFKLYNFTRDILLRIEKFDNTDELKQRIQNRMLELSGKSEAELKKYYRIGEKQYSSFREYGIEYIYKHIDYNINGYYISGEGRILENSFARIFANAAHLYMKEQGIFSKYNEGRERTMIEFFKTEQDIEKYLNTVILEDKFHGKCKAIKSDKKGGMFTDYQTYTIQGFGEYKGEFRNPSDCGGYGAGYGIRYFEKRGDYIIYINAGQDFNNLYFDLLEMK